MYEDIKYLRMIWPKEANTLINTISDVWHIRINKSFTTNNKLIPSTNKSCTYKNKLVEANHKSFTIQIINN